MLDPVSVALKFGFLAVLYLFLLWVARSALKDLRRGAAASRRPARARARCRRSPPRRPASTSARRPASLLVVESAPGHQPGSRYDVADGATLGRGDVEIVLEDPFASSQHARDRAPGRRHGARGPRLDERHVPQRGAARGPQPLHAGDRVRIGDSVFVVPGLAMLRVAEEFHATHTGRQRRANEDSLYARAPLFAVADGMGGAQAGEIASRIAVETLGGGVPEDGGAGRGAPRRARPRGQRAHPRAVASATSAAPAWARR